MGSTVTTLTGRGGIPLYRQSWRPDGEPRACALLVHGHGEYSGEPNFGALIRALLQRNVSVEAFDLRGHGRSGGPPGALDDWADYAGDLEAARAAAEAGTKGGPLFLFGHSMGGLIAADHALARPAGLRGVALTGPLLVNPVLPLPLKIFEAVFGLLAPGWVIPTGKRPADNTDLPAEIERLKRDLAFAPCGSVRMKRILDARVDLLNARAREFSAPLLVLHGTADRLVAIAGSRHLHAAAASPDKRFSPYEGMPHHLLISSCAEKAAAELAQWMAERA